MPVNSSPLTTHSAPAEIVALVERFNQQHDAYCAGRYNETQLRRDFLDPLFEALGWDMTNCKNYSEKFREVVHEVSVEVEGQAKAADYAFRSGGSTLFFLEAKKPSVNIATHPDPAFQIRSYAWSAKLTVSVLSDFEQLAVYDCRVKPVHGNAAHIGRVRLYNYTDYIEKWADLYRLLSFQAVHEGSLERLIGDLKAARGTADVDDDFLALMEDWREQLARNIALRNPALSQREINHAVQLTIDRIIFLRICEERGIEAENALRDATDGKDVYGDLLVLFRQADKKYNSGLFHFSAEKGRTSYPDTLTPNIKIDDKVFKDILANLYYPRSPYAFKYIPADILGQVYERFLGKIITLSAGHRATVVEKPEVRKAGGVYYTPTYIVDYIVKNTVGELLKDKDPDILQSTPLRVLDPACGSGSFLLGAYQYLLDWYQDWYSQHDPEKWARGKNPPIFETRGGWQLTMEKKKDILTRHIFGVDIDAQAVEVTKLSLLLKVVENPGQLSLIGERILPDLGDNIKCGNSLISPEYSPAQLSLLDQEEFYKINPFDWNVNFPFVTQFGGFDVVIGNPPYSAKQSVETKKLMEYYKAIEYKCDPYALFIEQGLRKLKIRGKLGFIVPVTWMTNYYYMKLRKLLIDTNSLQRIILLDGLVFEDANVDTCLLFLAKEDVKEEFEWLKTKPTNLINPFLLRAYNKVRNETRYDIVPNSDDNWEIIREKVDNASVRLDSLVKISLGMKLRSNDEFVVKNQDEKHPDGIFFGSDISRYGFCEPTRFFNFNKAVIIGGTKKPEIHKANPKILIQAIRNLKLKRRIVAAMETKGDCFIGTVNGVTLATNDYSINYLLGLINSTLINDYFSKRFTTISLTASFLGAIPIRKINFSDSTDVGIHNKMVTLVEGMLGLHKQLAAARLPDEKERLQRQIQATDRQIDKLVYELYGLTDAEIKIVEGEN